MNHNFAPILIPTLNRIKHFERCVNSLRECELSSQTDLFIALDYPLNESHWKGYNKILKFVNEIQGFKSVNIIKRETNFGANKNGSDALNFIFSKYETLIFSEDDNVFSKDFLVFTNKCLETFKDDEGIFSVCGYNYPVKIPKTYKEHIFGWQGYSAWGVGLWRDKFLKIDWSSGVVESKVKIFLKNYLNVFRFNSIANIYVPALMHMLNLKAIHGDIYICMHQFLNNMSSVFPVESRVRNIGNDGSGVNCTALEDDVYIRQSIYEGSSDYVIPKEIKQNIEINKILSKHFHRSLNSKIKTYCILFLMNMGWYDKLRLLKSRING